MDLDQSYKLERLAPPGASATSHIQAGSLPGLRATWSHDPSASASRNGYQRKSFQAQSEFEKLHNVVSSPPILFSSLSKDTNNESSGTSLSGSVVGEFGSADEPDGQAVVSELLPVDRGRGAWTYLLVAFLVEGLCWGFPFSFGVFQAHYSRTEPFAGKTDVSAVGLLSLGIPYLLSLFLFPVISRYLNYRKSIMWLGLFLCVLSCITSSFASKVWHLVLAQGALYGLGTMFLYTPTFSLMNEWFVKRRGLAYGVMFGGTGCSGLILPFLFEQLLSRYGHAMTLRIWGTVLVVLTSPALYFMKPRLPVSATTRHPDAVHRPIKWIDWYFIKSRTFQVFAFTNFFQGLGYFLPSIYLPSYALDLSLPPVQSTIVLSILNLASVFGQIGFGWLSDNYDIYLVMFGSTSVSAIAVYLLWGLSKSFGVLAAFAIIYGLSAGGFSVLWTRFGSVVSGDDSSSSVLTLLGVFSFQRGIGNILSGPISSTLVGSTVSKGTGEDIGYGLKKYEGVIVFVGSVMLVSCLGVGGRLLRPTGAPST